MADKEISSHEFSLDRIEDDNAVLLDEDDEELVLPAKLLPSDVKDGEVLVFTISTDSAERRRREKTAKELLNEILGPKKDR